MITWNDLYTVLSAVVPLYVAMILAYGSVRWWKIFTPDQCSGINRFVAIFAVPLLSFHFISTNDLYTMNFRFVLADTIQKLLILAGLTLWLNLTNYGSLDWLITIFSLSTQPNTLVMGIPLLIAMYGPYSGNLMVQLVVLQCIIWYTLLLFLFEYRAAKLLISEQFPGGAAADIVSFKVESDVMSLDAGPDFLQTDAEIGGDGKIHVTVRKSTSSRRSVSMMTPRPSNLTGAEIYSLSSSRNPTPRGSNFNHGDFYSMMGPIPMRPSNLAQADLYSLQSSRGPTPRPSSFEGSSPKLGPHYPAPNPDIASASASTKGEGKGKTGQNNSSNSNHDAKELHMFVWSSTTSPVSDAAAGLHIFGGPEEQAAGAKEIRMLVPQADVSNFKSTPEGTNGTSMPATAGEHDTMGGVGAMTELKFRAEDLKGGGSRREQMPPASVMTRLILIMVWRKLIRNPNTYSSLVGVIWALIAYRWNVKMPKIVEKSISILSDAGLGMAMFSLGIFMALQPRLIACGNKVATFAMAVRFLTGPAVMAAASIAVGLHGTLLHVAIVQAALPQGIVPFVFAKEYNVHPAILSTAVIFGMLIALPITLLYYILLGI